MSRVSMRIWNRIFILEVYYECHGNQEPTISQHKSLDAFLSHEKAINASFDKVCQYCLEDENLQSMKEIDNIFKYVVPQSIYVTRDESKRTVALMCDYKFDIEHGLAIVFENEKCVEVVPQGDIL